MAAEDAGDERSLELQFEGELKEQRESLAALDEALAADPSNPDLISVHEDLIRLIKDVEGGLLHLKRSRLLLEADALSSKFETEADAQNVDVEPPGSSDLDTVESEQYSVGSKCRFRHSDGRWYNGHLIGLEDANYAKISFLNPTTENMTICKFFLQRVCRFGNNCRMSHGVNIPISSLKRYIPTAWQQSLVGSNIWAVSDTIRGIWTKAELESWDENLQQAEVVFQNGDSAKLGIEAITLSRYAQMSDAEEELSSEETDSSRDEDFENEVAHEGLGFMENTMAQTGVQTDTAIFAKWEKHTRGIASKMMVGMGYREGMGLGASGQGIVDPIIAKMLPPKQSLGYVNNERSENNVKKKRSRGGKRKRDKKFAEAARAAKAESQPEANLFNFINEQLVGQNSADRSSTREQKGGRGETHESIKREDRKSLIGHEDKVKDLRLQVGRLEEMVNRNRKDKVMFQAISKRLKRTLKELNDAEAVLASASNAVVSKEKEKKWLKF